MSTTSCFHPILDLARYLMYLTSLLHGENIGLSSRKIFYFVCVRKGCVVGTASKNTGETQLKGEGVK